MLYSKLGNTEITGNSSVINLAHASKYAVSAATIAFSFEADTVSGRRGLLTKDAYGYEGGGNHFAAYLRDGTLNVMFEGASTRKTFTVSGINANQEYDLQASFGGGKVLVWLDDKLVGSSSFETDLDHQQGISADRRPWRLERERWVGLSVRVRRHHLGRAHRRGRAEPRGDGHAALAGSGLLPRRNVDRGIDQCRERRYPQAT